MKDLKKIFRFMKYEKFNFFMSCFLIIIEIVLELLIPFLMKDIINVGIKNNDMTAIIKTGIIIIACALISLICGVFYARFNAKAISNYTMHLREEVFRHIQEYSFSNLDHFETSSLITRCTNDVQVIQNTLSGSIRPVLRAPLMLILGVGLSIAISPSLAWIFAIVVPILGLVLVLILKYTAPKYNEIQTNIDNLNLVVREDITSIRTVKSYVREEYEMQKFDKTNKNVKDITTSTFKIAVINQPSFQFSMYFITVLLLFFGARMVNNNTLEVGSLSALLSYVLQVCNSLMMLSNVFLLVNKSFASARRINDVLEEEPTIKSGGEYKVKDGNIEFKNVSFKYNALSKEYAIKDINLNIPYGTSVGIMGGTGSAKSTLVSLILRLYDVTEGEILIDGINVCDYDLKNLRDNISIVLQNNVLFSGSVKDNLLWGNKDASDEEIDRVLKLSRSDEFIDRLPGGLTYDLGQGGVNVSGGQRQRLCIARALLKKPKIIIFDDSTSACDMQTEREILKGIRSLNNVTNIIIGQRVTSVMDADLIVILDDGKISDVGTHETLQKTSHIYKELCDVQLRGEKNGVSSK